jgi:hypothetical protein
MRFRQLVQWCVFTVSIFACVEKADAAINLIGYYFAYSGGLGDFMNETAAFTNVIFIQPEDINWNTDQTAVDAVRRARSLGLKVILDVRGGFPGLIALPPNFKDTWDRYRGAYGIADMVRNGDVFAFYFADEPNLIPVPVSDQVLVIEAIHDTLSLSEIRPAPAGEHRRSISRLPYATSWPENAKLSSRRRALPHCKQAATGVMGSVIGASARRNAPAGFYRSRSSRLTATAPDQTTPSRRP